MRMAKPVSTTSEDVMPMCMYLDDAPTWFASDSVKAIRSCLVRSSILSISATSKAAFFFMFARSFLGILPFFPQASHTATSTSSHDWNLASSVQSEPLFSSV